MATRSSAREPMGQVGYKLPVRLAAIIVLSMVTGEFLEILVFAALPPLPEVVETLLDALLLTVVAAPLLFFLLVRPMSTEIRKRRQAEAELDELNRDLEHRIEERTVALSASNKRVMEESEQRRYAEDDAWKSRTFIRSVVESAPYLVMIYDVESRRCDYVNGRLTDVLGYSPEAACAGGTDFLLDVMDAESYRSLMTLGQSGTEDENPTATTYEWRMRTSAGEYRRLRVRATLLPNGPGKSPHEILFTAIPD
jgi:PAS domain-containing protein